MKRVIFIGAGKGGKALLELLHEDPTVKIVGVVDINEQAVGFALARKLGLPVTTNYRELLTSTTADPIIDATGDPEVGRELYALKSDRTELVGPAGARFFWEFIINTFTITLPPLRERIEDVPILSEYFLQRARAKINKRVETISPQAITLRRY